MLRQGMVRLAQPAGTPTKVPSASAGVLLVHRTLLEDQPVRMFLIVYALQVCLGPTEEATVVCVHLENIKASLALPSAYLVPSTQSHQKGAHLWQIAHVIRALLVMMGAHALVVKRGRTKIRRAVQNASNQS